MNATTKRAAVRLLPVLLAAFVLGMHAGAVLALRHRPASVPDAGALELPSNGARIDLGNPGVLMGGEADRWDFSAAVPGTRVCLGNGCCWVKGGGGGWISTGVCP